MLASSDPTVRVLNLGIVQQVGVKEKEGDMKPTVIQNFAMI